MTSKLNVLLITRDSVMMNIFYETFLELDIELQTCLVTKDKNLWFNHPVIFVSKIDINIIVEAILNTKETYDFVFTNDELLVDKVEEISKQIGCKCFQKSSVFDRNKIHLKELAKECGILTPGYELVNKISSFSVKEKELKLPLVVKPIDGFASNGVQVVKNIENLNYALRNVFKQNTIKKELYGDTLFSCMLEEYIEGEEFSIDVIWNDSKPITTIICSRLHRDLVYCPDYIYYNEPELADDIREGLILNAIKIGTKMKIEFGATHSEFILKGNKLYLIDNAVRPGGGGMIYYSFDKTVNSNSLLDFCKSICGITIKKSIEHIKSPINNFLLFYGNRKSGFFEEITLTHIPDGVKIIKIIQAIGNNTKIPNPIDFNIYLFFIIGVTKKLNKKEFSMLMESLDNSIQIKYSKI